MPITSNKIPELDSAQKQTVVNLWTKFVKMNEAHRRPALYFTFTEYKNPEEGISDRFASKLGGHPFWPNDPVRFPYKGFNTTSSPNNDDDDDTSNMGNLRLLAQFNLSEIPVHHRQALHLPEDGGILQFYVAQDDCWGQFGPNSGHASSTTYRVKHWSEEIVSNTTQCLPEENFPVISEKETLEAGASFPLLPFVPHKPLQVSFDKDLTHDMWSFSDDKTRDGFDKYLRQEAPEIVNHLCQPDPEKDKWKICAVWDPIMEASSGVAGGNARDPCSGSKLGGHPVFTQDDPRHSWSSERSCQLLQLDSENGVMIGDCGLMHFFNSDASSSRCQFDGVEYTWDCC